MVMPMSATDPALERSFELARSYLAGVADRPVWWRSSYDDLVQRLRGPLQNDPVPPEQVVEELADWADPGLAATGSGRYYGFVVGGAHPAALAADWLTLAWDQNAGLLNLAPAAAAAESVAAEWILDLLDLPRVATVGFTTGATVAGFVCLGAARHQVLAKAGHDVERQGLASAPRVRILAGADRHTSIDLAVRYLGLGSDNLEPVDTDDAGRIDVDDLRRRLSREPGPTIVCLQAGEVHTGAFDHFGPAIDAAHTAGAWVHVDGAFGLWARAGTQTRSLTEDVDRADSWSTDAHKTLNVPYDSGLAIVRDGTVLGAAFGVEGDYLMPGSTSDPHGKVPEMSRRARGFAIWAVLRALGAHGVAALPDRLHRRAVRMADGIRAIDGARVRNDVVFTQVMASFGDDEQTDEVGRRLLAEGTAAITPATWRGRRVQRISLSNWSTTEADVDATVAALARITAEVLSGTREAQDLSR